MPNISKYIVIDNQILNGTPVIAGTRIPIERISALVNHGYYAENLKEEFPQVKLKTLQHLISVLMNVGLDEYKKKVQTTPWWGATTQREVS